MIKDVAPVIAGNRVVLPSGMVYADAADITQTERSELDAAVNGPYDSPLDKPDWGTRGYFGISECIDVGVRSTEDAGLVGIGRLLISDVAGARIDLNLKRGNLSHFMVHPDYQRRGIGTAILLERMRIAEELDVPELFVELDEGNTLRDKYYELGFEEDAAGALRLDRRVTA